MFSLSKLHEAHVNIIVVLPLNVALLTGLPSVVVALNAGSMFPLHEASSMSMLRCILTSSPLSGWFINGSSSLAFFTYSVFPLHTKYLFIRYIATCDLGLSLMKVSAIFTVSGGLADATACLKSLISSLSFVPVVVICFRCEASAFMSTLLPGSAKTGCSEKLGKTSISVPFLLHGMSRENRPPFTFMVSMPFVSPSLLYT